MKIVHVSDTHGYMPKLLEGDVVVHSGDFCPNRSFGIRSIEDTYQPYWIESKGPQLRAWIGERPLLIVHGNHDFINTVSLLRAQGIEAYDLDDKRLDHGGLVFHGFPWVPSFGPWNRGISEKEISLRLLQVDMEGVDIFVSHCPMYGVLDRNAEGERCGSRSLRSHFQESPHVPKYLLHGHIHEAAGILGWSRGMIVSNAATTQRIIDV